MVDNVNLYYEYKLIKSTIMKSNPSGKPDNEDVLEQLNALMFVFRSEMRRALHEAGYAFNGMEVRMFLRIAEHPGCAASDLVRDSGRDKAQVTRLIQQLEQTGFVRREPDEQDRRVQRLFVTEAGEQLHGKLRRWRQAVAHRLMGRLSEEEQAQLARLLARMRPDQSE
jgi:DNA-binding MarR family transcriptional regulator